MYINNLQKQYGPLEVLKDFTYSFQKNKVTVLFGPSGCGKTTLLNCIAGLVSPDNGEIGHSLDTGTSYIFQAPTLLPWKTVYQNIQLVIKGHIPKGEEENHIKGFLEMTEMSEFAGYYPHQLSGGMKQRVNIARAFAYPGMLLLLDEPFKGLDIKIKNDLIEAFHTLWKKDPKTTVLVTHDIHEALVLGDEILILSPRPMEISKVLRQRSSFETSFEQRKPGQPEYQKLEQILYQTVLSTGKEI